MRVLPVPFGEWLPDMPDFQNPGLLEAENTYPSAGGYAPFESPVLESATTTEQVNGAAVYFTTSNVPLIVGGSSTRLFTLRVATVTETSGLTAASAWKFERFNDLIVAVSIENNPQYLTDIDTDNTWSALGGSPPKAAQIGKVNDHLVLGDLVDISGLGSPTTPNRVRWSAKNSPTTAWVTDRGEMSDFRDLDPRYGRITGIVGGRYGIVFQERAVWRMEFVGTPKVFEFVPISTDVGSIAGGAPVYVGTNLYFIGQNGFYLTNGQSVASIGESRVNEWFRGLVDDSTMNQTHASINWPKQSIVWAFKDQGATRFTKQIIYNFALDRWSHAAQEIDYLASDQESNETLGSLVSTYATLGDAGSIPLGSLQFKASDIMFSAFVEDPGNGSQYARMTGSPLAASFVTGETSITPGYRSEVSGVWPGVTSISNAITTSVRSRSYEGGALRTTPESVRGVDGFCPHKIDDWIHSVRMKIPAGEVWDKAQNIRVRVTRTGRR